MTWLPKKSVIVPIDFSDQSFAALDVACDLVETVADLHVIHVLPELLVSEPGMVWGPVDEQARRAHAEESLRERLTDPKFDNIDVQIRIGDRGAKIVEFAEQIEAELIVMPSHGRSGLERILIGSVAERVLRLAHCPVLVLRQ